MLSLNYLLQRYKGTSSEAPIAVGVRKSNMILMECGGLGYRDCSDDCNCDCGNCECYECYDCYSND